jgi:hypothetical protein
VVVVITRLHVTAAQAAARFTLQHLLHQEQAQPIKATQAETDFLQQAAAVVVVRYNSVKQPLRLKLATVATV